MQARRAAFPVPNGADIAKNTLAMQWRNCPSTRWFFEVINGPGRPPDPQGGRGERRNPRSRH
jgi:hypothetical protein